MRSFFEWRKSISSKSFVESPWRLPIDSNFQRRTSATGLSTVSLATTE
jgi:hypothetical protein